MTINELLEGKGILIKNKEYYPTKHYVEPFLERMSKYTNEFDVKVKSADQLSMTNKDADTMFNRVWIQAILPESYYFEENHKQVVGMIYGLDVKNPVVKFYKGGLNMACTNLCVFNPDFLNVQPLSINEPINYNPITELMEKVDDIAWRIRSMKNQYIGDDLQKHLGDWVDFTLKQTYSQNYGKIKLASSVPINAYEDLFLKEDSKYFIKHQHDVDMFTVYNAFTDIITHDKKDIMTTYEKIVLVSDMLGLNK